VAWRSRWPRGSRVRLQPVCAGLVLIEGIDENTHLLETSEWGRLYLAVTRWFASNVP